MNRRARRGSMHDQTVSLPTDIAGRTRSHRLVRLVLVVAVVLVVLVVIVLVVIVLVVLVVVLVLVVLVLGLHLVVEWGLDRGLLLAPCPWTGPARGLDVVGTGDRPTSARASKCAKSRSERLLSAL